MLNREKRTKGRLLRLYPGGMLAAVGLGSAFNVILLNTPLPELSPGFQEVARKEAEVSPVQGIVLFCLFAPLLEEFIFRFLLCLLPEHFLKKLLPPRISGGFFLVFSSLAFALAHGNIVQGIYAFFMGILFAAFALSAGNPLISFLMHMLSNLTVYSVSALGFGFVLLSPLTGLCAFGLGLFGLWYAFSPLPERNKSAPEYPE